MTGVNGKATEEPAGEARAARSTGVDRRSRLWRELSGRLDVVTDHGDEEIIDGVRFNYAAESRCKVCGVGSEREPLAHAQEVRGTVDRGLLNGATYASILRSIQSLVESWPAERRPSVHSIRRHQLRHLPADAAAVREIVERRARREGLRVIVGDGRVVTRGALLEVIRDRGFAALAAGKLRPTLAETLQAAQALEELDRVAGELLSPGELAEQMGMFVDVVRANVPEDAWRQIVAEMEGEGAAPAALPAETKEDKDGTAD